MAQDASLHDVIERLKAEGQLTRNSGTNSLKSLKDGMDKAGTLVGNGLKDLNYVSSLTLGRMDALLDVFSGNALAALEKERENAARLDEQQNTLEEIAKNTIPKKEEKEEGSDGGVGFMLAGLAATAGLATGAVAGWIKAVQLAISPLTKLTGAVFRVATRITSFVGRITGITPLLDTVMDAFKGIPARIATAVESIVASIKAVFAGAGKGDGLIGKIIGAITKYTDDVARAFNSAVDTFKAVTESAGKFTSKVSRIRSFLTGIVSRFSILGKIFGVFKTLASKIFYPISLVIASIEAVSASWEEFANGDILAGLETLVTTFFDSLIVAPFDMIKDAIAWIIGKLGFDETSEAISSFSFSDQWKKLTGAIFDGIGAAIDWIKLMFTDPTEGLSQLWNGLLAGYDSIASWLSGMISMPINWVMEKFGWKEEGMPEFDLWQFIKDTVDDIWELLKGMFDFSGVQLPAFGNMAEDFMKMILRNILPTPDGDAAWYDVSNLVSKAIPDSVYTYAGLNPNTGEELDTTEAIQAAITAGDIDTDVGAEMIARLEEIANAEAEREAQARAAVIAQGGQTTVTVQGGQTQTLTVGQTALPDRVGGSLQGVGDPAYR